MDKKSTLNIRVIDRDTDQELNAITAIHMDGDTIHAVSAISNLGDEKLFRNIEIKSLEIK